MRAAFELWTEPTAQYIISADGSVSTIVHTYSARAAAGWRVLGLFYAGPEVQAFASDGYAQQRVGVHVTAFKAGTLEWSAATGYARDSDRRSSAYVRFGISTKR